VALALLPVLAALILGLLELADQVFDRLGALALFHRHPLCPEVTHDGPPQPEMRPMSESCRFPVPYRLQVEAVVTPTRWLPRLLGRLVARPPQLLQRIPERVNRVVVLILRSEERRVGNAGRAPRPAGW